MFDMHDAGALAPQRPAGAIAEMIAGAVVAAPATTAATAATGAIGPMARPKPLARAARSAARSYRRMRDLPGAVPGLAAAPEAEILPRLAAAEARCEIARQARAAGYRPAQHLQILAALLAEARRAAGPGR
ncbi:hypothetical protein LNKW23_00680 [Paralimibaculum aggregatum]|uniref:Uncharacterized protein n=1 Tax=Paralimibaculum aggregatum TaxID=3036245 RepID=A0ABQ6LKB8_9RHOB|nr:DUF6477 family protein [Limibaculum sp. NKW23]GMG80856.1 hypothetical protein LNKW23_00680 [Limibaculum sp. NKW23]